MADKKTDQELTQQVWDFGLLFALRRGDCEVSQHAIALGADVHTNEANFMPVLHSAIGHTESKFASDIPERLECVKLLISHGADIEKRNSDGETALAYAARMNMAEIAEYLLDAGANFSDVNDQHQNIAKMAYSSGYIDEEIIDMLRNRPEMAEFFVEAWADDGYDLHRYN